MLFSRLQAILLHLAVLYASTPSSMTADRIALSVKLSLSLIGDVAAAAAALATR